MKPVYQRPHRKPEYHRKNDDYRKPSLIDLADSVATLKVQVSDMHQQLYRLKKKVEKLENPNIKG